MRLITSEEVAQVSGSGYLEEIGNAISSFWNSFGSKGSTPTPPSTCVPSNNSNNSASMMCGAGGTSVARIQAGNNVVIAATNPSWGGNLSVNIAGKAGGSGQIGGAPTTSWLVCPINAKCYFPKQEK